MEVMEVTTITDFFERSPPGRKYRILVTFVTSLPVPRKQQAQIHILDEAAISGSGSCFVPARSLPCT